ncbi:hypothetical protein I4U23_023570 [Adineta vaga]|nr:hypothetical protein I4U23_023570 [Adineta vaga]
MDMYATNKKKIDNWIQFITEGIRILMNFNVLLAKSDNIFPSKSSSFQENQPHISRFILRLIIHVTEKYDPFLNEMFQYLIDNTNHYVNTSTKINCWFSQDNFTSIQNKIILFSEFAQENRKNADVQYFVEEQYADVFHMNKDVSIILYRNGIITNFEIPSRPGQPRATNISADNLTLTWLKPIYGSQTIQQYKVYGQIDGTNRWALLHISANDTPCTVISKLPEGKYRFKIKGITIIGDTTESDPSDIVNTTIAKPISIPLPRPVTSLPIVTTNEITREKAILDVMPAWFDQVKSVPLEKNSSTI